MADDSSMPAVFSGMQSGKKLFNCEWCHIHFDNEHKYQQHCNSQLHYLKIAENLIIPVDQLSQMAGPGGTRRPPGMMPSSVQPGPLGALGMGLSNIPGERLGPGGMLQGRMMDIAGALSARTGGNARDAEPHGLSGAGRYPGSGNMSSLGSGRQLPVSTHQGAVLPGRTSGVMPLMGVQTVRPVGILRTSSSGSGSLGSQGTHNKAGSMGVTEQSRHQQQSTQGTGHQSGGFGLGDRRHFGSSSLDPAHNRKIDDDQRSPPFIDSSPRFPPTNVNRDAVDPQRRPTFQRKISLDEAPDVDDSKPIFQTSDTQGWIRAEEDRDPPKSSSMSEDHTPIFSSHTFSSLLKPEEPKKDYWESTASSKARSIMSSLMASRYEEPEAPHQASTGIPGLDLVPEPAPKKITKPSKPRELVPNVDHNRPKPPPVSHSVSGMSDVTEENLYGKHREPDPKPAPVYEKPFETIQKSKGRSLVSEEYNDEDAEQESKPYDYDAMVKRIEDRFKAYDVHESSRVRDPVQTGRERYGKTFLHDISPERVHDFSDDRLDIDISSKTYQNNSLDMPDERRYMSPDDYKVIPERSRDYWKSDHPDNRSSRQIHESSYDRRREQLRGYSPEAMRYSSPGGHERNSVEQSAHDFARGRFETASSERKYDRYDRRISPKRDILGQDIPDMRHRDYSELIENRIRAEDYRRFDELSRPVFNQYDDDRGRRRSLSPVMDHRSRSPRRRSISPVRRSLRQQAVSPVSRSSQLQSSSPLRWSPQRQSLSPVNSRWLDRSLEVRDKYPDDVRSQERTRPHDERLSFRERSVENVHDSPLRTEERSKHSKDKTKSDSKYEKHSTSHKSDAGKDSFVSKHRSRKDDSPLDKHRREGSESKSRYSDREQRHKDENTFTSKTMEKVDSKAKSIPSKDTYENTKSKNVEISKKGYSDMKKSKIVEEKVEPEGARRQSQLKPVRTTMATREVSKGQGEDKYRVPLTVAHTEKEGLSDRVTARGSGDTSSASKLVSKKSESNNQKKGKSGKKGDSSAKKRKGVELYDPFNHDSESDEDLEIKKLREILPKSVRDTISYLSSIKEAPKMVPPPENIPAVTIASQYSDKISQKSRKSDKITSVTGPAEKPATVDGDSSDSEPEVFPPAKKTKETNEPFGKKISINLIKPVDTRPIKQKKKKAVVSGFKGTPSNVPSIIDCLTVTTVSDTLVTTSSSSIVSPASFEDRVKTALANVTKKALDIHKSLAAPSGATSQIQASKAAAFISPNAPLASVSLGSNVSPVGDVDMRLKDVDMRIAGVRGEYNSGSQASAASTPVNTVIAASAMAPPVQPFMGPPIQRGSNVPSQGTGFPMQQHQVAMMQSNMSAPMMSTGMPHQPQPPMAAFNPPPGIQQPGSMPFQQPNVSMMGSMNNPANAITAMRPSGNTVTPFRQPPPPVMGSMNSMVNPTAGVFSSGNVTNPFQGPPVPGFGGANTMVNTAPGMLPPHSIGSPFQRPPVSMMGSVNTMNNPAANVISNIRAPQFQQPPVPGVDHVPNMINTSSGLTPISNAPLPFSTMQGPGNRMMGPSGSMLGNDPSSMASRNLLGNVIAGIMVRALAPGALQGSSGFMQGNTHINQNAGFSRPTVSGTSFKDNVPNIPVCTQPSLASNPAKNTLCGFVSSSGPQITVVPQPRTNEPLSSESNYTIPPVSRPPVTTAAPKIVTDRRNLVSVPINKGRDDGRYKKIQDSISSNPGKRKASPPRRDSKRVCHSPSDDKKFSGESDSKRTASSAGRGNDNDRKYMSDSRKGTSERKSSVKSDDKDGGEEHRSDSKKSTSSTKPSTKSDEKKSADVRNEQDSKKSNSSSKPSTKSHGKKSDVGNEQDSKKSTSGTKPSTESDGKTSADVGNEQVKITDAPHASCGKSTPDAEKKSDAKASSEPKNTDDNKDDSLSTKEKSSGDSASLGAKKAASPKSGTDTVKRKSPRSERKSEKSRSASGSEGATEPVGRMTRQRAKEISSKTKSDTSNKDDPEVLDQRKTRSQRAKSKPSNEKSKSGSSPSASSQKSKAAVVSGKEDDKSSDDVASDAKPSSQEVTSESAKREVETSDFLKSAPWMMEADGDIDVKAQTSLAASKLARHAKSEEKSLPVAEAEGKHSNDDKSAVKKDKGSSDKYLVSQQHKTTGNKIHEVIIIEDDDEREKYAGEKPKQGEKGGKNVPEEIMDSSRKANDKTKGKIAESQLVSDTNSEKEEKLKSNPVSSDKPPKSAEIVKPDPAAVAKALAIGKRIVSQADTNSEKEGKTKSNRISSNNPPKSSEIVKPDPEAVAKALAIGKRLVSQAGKSAELGDRRGLFPCKDKHGDKAKFSSTSTSGRDLDRKGSDVQEGTLKPTTAASAKSPSQVPNPFVTKSNEPTINVSSVSKTGNTQSATQVPNPFITGIVSEKNQVTNSEVGKSDVKSKPLSDVPNLGRSGEKGKVQPTSKESHTNEKIQVKSSRFEQKKSDSGQQKIEAVKSSVATEDLAKKRQGKSSRFEPVKSEFGKSTKIEDKKPSAARGGPPEKIQTKLSRFEPMNSGSGKFQKMDDRKSPSVKAGPAVVRPSTSGAASSSSSFTTKSQDTDLRPGKPLRSRWNAPAEESKINRGAGKSRGRGRGGPGHFRGGNFDRRNPPFGLGSLEPGCTPDFPIIGGQDVDLRQQPPPNFEPGFPENEPPRDGPNFGNWAPRDERENWHEGEGGPQNRDRGRFNEERFRDEDIRSRHSGHGYEEHDHPKHRGRSQEQSPFRNQDNRERDFLPRHDSRDRDFDNGRHNERGRDFDPGRHNQRDRNFDHGRHNERDRNFDQGRHEWDRNIDQGRHDDRDRNFDQGRHDDRDRNFDQGRHDERRDFGPRGDNRDRDIDRRDRRGSRERDYDSGRGSRDRDFDRDRRRDSRGRDYSPRRDGPDRGFNPGQVETDTDMRERGHFDDRRRDGREAQMAPGPDFPREDIMLEEWQRDEILQILPSQYSPEQVQEFIWILIDNMRILIESFQNTQDISPGQLMDMLNDEDRDNVLQMQEMTGMQDIGPAARLIYVLRGMDSDVVNVLGALDSGLLQSLAMADPRRQGDEQVSIQDILSSLGVGGEGPPPMMGLPGGPPQDEDMRFNPRPDDFPNDYGPPLVVEMGPGQERQVQFGGPDGPPGPNRDRDFRPRGGRGGRGFRGRGRGRGRGKSNFRGRNH